MTLKVLHVGKFYPPVSGGIEKVVQVLCEAEQSTLDSEVLVAHTERTTVREVAGGVPVTRVGILGKVGAVALCPMFPFWMRRIKTDVMVIHEPNPVAIVAHWLARPRARIVVWVHAEVVRAEWRYNLFYRPFLRRVLHLADRIVVASPPVAAHAAELRDFSSKCTVIPYAIDPDQHRLTVTGERRVQQIRQQRSEPIALFVGRMVPYKGVDILLRALVDAPVRAILVGDGPRRAEWTALASALGVSDRVTFAGEVDGEELAALYHACDMFVLPSVTKAEAFGMVQVEAMACRKPVISTDLAGSGVPWVNQHEVTGLVVPPSNVTALRQAMAHLAATPALRAQMGNAGRARVVREFSIPRLAEQTLRLYREVMGWPIDSEDAGSESLAS